MELRQRTINLKRKARLYGFLSNVLTLMPVAIYFVVAFASGSVAQKTSLGFMFTAALFITVLNFAKKLQLRSALWIMILGIYTVIRNLIPLLLLTAILTILDEFIFAPKYKKYSRLAETNVEIDRAHG